MSEPIKKKQFEAVLYSAVGVAAMLVLLIGFNIVAGALKQRIDMTEEKAFTLSSGTREILNGLDTPVKIYFYCTRVKNATPDSVFLRNYAQQVEDLLDEMRLASNGKITIERLDPQPDSDAEISAKLDGLEGQPLPPYGENFYLGLTVACVDQKVSIPFLSPTRERLLEYDVARAISQAEQEEKTVVGVMSGLPVFGTPMNPMMMRTGQQGQEPWIFLSELRRDFDVREISLTTESIEDDVNLLVVVYPKNISEATQYAIDQFVLRGGKLLAFVDPLSMADTPMPGMNPLQQATSSGATMEKLLQSWGVEFDMSKAVADMTYKARINRGGRPEEAPSVLLLNKTAMNSDDVLTSQIDNLLLPYVGALEGQAPEGLKRTVLFHSSEDSQLVDKIMAQFGGVQNDFKAADIEYPLAIRLAGKFKTAFPDGKPGAGTEEKEEGGEGDATEGPEPPVESLKESKADTVVLLVGDSDILYDPVVAQVQNIFGQRIIIPQNGNLNLVQSMVEQMAGDSRLIEVRSRATLQRPFTVVREMEQKAQEAYRSKIRDLEASLSDTRAKLNELGRGKEGNQQFILSPEQQEELIRFREKEASVNKELREVRKNLRADIESLQNRLKWINIGLMPVAIALFGIAMAVYKRKKTAAR